jgi:pimeloyl-ACP methyl ester carboxylesterase
MLQRVLKTVGVVLLVLLALALIVPLALPIPPLENTIAPEQLADADSQFMDVNGLRVHYKKTGDGETAFVLLHGFASNTYTWDKVLREFGARGTTLAYDRPAFGLTSRPLPGEWQGENPYSPEANVDLLFALLDAQGIDKAILVGNSAGGAVAMDAALQHPERVQGLILVDAAIYEGGGRPAWLAPILNLPQVQRIGPLLVRGIADSGMELLKTAYHDPNKLTAETIAAYRKPLRAHNWDIGLWQFTTAAQSRQLAARLTELKMPVLVVTGDDDRIVPTASSLRLAREIPGAQLAVLPQCGHVPQEECPAAFMQAVNPFVAKLEAAQP